MSTPDRHRSLGIVALVAALALLAACGIPREDEPRAIETDGSLTTTTAPEAPGPTSREVALYFVTDDGLLTRVDRGVEMAPDPQLAVIELLAGVTDKDREDGALSAIPQNTRLLRSVTTEGSILLDLSEEITTIQGEKLTQAYAQIVYTATAFQDIRQVRFEVEGQPIDVPTSDDANLTVVTRSSYRSLCDPASCP